MSKVNPKQIQGEKKPPLAYVPMVAELAMLEALYDGALKYEPHNWRDNPIQLMTYVHAAERHLKLFSVGENLTRDTLVQNLGATMACCGILLDAMAHDSFIDDRRHSKVDADALYDAEEWVKRLQGLQRERIAGQTPQPAEE